jgi:hypothetical protein
MRTLASELSISGTSRAKRSICRSFFMGREGFEPSTLGLRVDAGAFAASLKGRRSRVVEPNRLGLARAVSWPLVDRALT